jgi:hypothetical protein
MLAKPRVFSDLLKKAIGKGAFQWGVMATTISITVDLQRGVWIILV